MVGRCISRRLVLATALVAGGVVHVQAQDGFRAELVGEGVISLADHGETFPALNADGDVLYFSRVQQGRGWAHQHILWSKWQEDHWGEPRMMPFSGGTASDRALRPAPDNTMVTFSSNRPLPGAEGVGEYNLWIIYREGEGWSAPQPVPGALNSDGRDAHGSVAQDGTIYFYSIRDEGEGRGDIYRSSPGPDGYGAAVNLGPPVNTAESQPDLWISPSQEWMILVITEHPDGHGGDDLYFSEFRDGAWTAPRNLGPAVNTPEYEYGPFMDPTGTWLYFISHRSGEGDIYRIELRELMRTLE
jgi:Tol biopolymer transport system component